MKRILFCKIACALMLVVLIASSAYADPWKFGIIADTQWPTSPDGLNPNSVAVNVINHINQEFINNGVKFVVAVGDVTDDGSNLALDTRATFAQALYNAGIGFYPLRGNHEPTNTAAIEWRRIFPQNQTGVNNQTPSNAFVTTPFYGAPPANTNTTFTVGSNFASRSADFAGLMYSFDYNNARFVLLDQFEPPSGVSHDHLDSTDISWVGTQLSGRPAGTHAFVFGHKHIMSENQVDTLFGSDPGNASTFPLQNSFMANLFNNGVRYYIGGHDHLYNRAIVTSPDGNSKVQDIIAQSDSSIIDTPPSPTNDYVYDDRNGTGPVPGNIYPREMEISQEVRTLGYLIVTVDGPNVTVDYYSLPSGCDSCSYDTISYTTGFTKRETFGYSLNGHEFLVPQGQQYSSVQDSYSGTTARILSGTNGSIETAGDGRQMTKVIDTGWTPGTTATASDILTLWGMADINADHTDTFVLSMTYNPAAVTDAQIQSGSFGLKVQDAGGNWTKDAVDLNVGGAKQFVLGQWNSSFSLGAYGVDTTTHTTWAVINHNGNFAAAYASGLNLPVAIISGAPASPTLATSATLTVGGTGIVEYKYTVDSGSQSAAVPIATPIVLSGLANGQHTISVIGKNGAGNWQTTPTTAAWVVDLTPPSTPGVPSAGGSFSTTTTITFTWAAANDPESGISGYNLQVGTTSGGSNVFDGNIGNVLSQAITGANGQDLYARVQAVNGVGVTGTWSAGSSRITIDAIAPVTTASPTGQSYQSSQSVTLGCSDTGGSGCSKTYYCTGTGCNPSILYNGAISIATSTDLRYFSIDVAGNSETVKTQTYTIVDSVAPSTIASATGYTFGSWTASSSVSVILTASDASSGVAAGYPKYCIDTTNTCTPNLSFAGAFNVTCSAGSTCTQSVRYQSVDKAGNAESVQSVQVNQDLKPPTTSATGAGYILGNWTPSGSITITLSSGDNSGSGVATGYPKYCIDTTNTCAPNSSYVSALNVICTAGSTCLQYIRYQAVDNTGNAEIVQSAQVKQDQQAPTMIISAPSSSMTGSASVAFTVTYSDANFNTSTLHAADVTLDRTGTANGSIATDSGTGNVRTVTISNITGDGTLGISIAGSTASDLAGNSAPPEGPSAIFTVDNTSPSLTLSTLADGSYTDNQTLNISGTTGDTNGVQSVVVNNQAVTLHTTDNINFTFSYPVTLLTGSNVVTTSVKDNAGNVTTDTRNIILDTVLPVLSLAAPADNSVTNSPTVTVTGTIDELSTVLLSVNSGPTVTAATNATSFSFPVSLQTNSINTINVYVKDRAGNTTTAKRTITNDETNPTIAVTVPSQDMGTNQNSIVVSGEIDDLTNISVLASCPTASVGLVSTPTRTTWSVHVTNLQPGVNSITIKATDQAGNSTSVIRNIVNISTPIAINAVTSPTNISGQTISGTREENASVVVDCPTGTVGPVNYPSGTTWQTVLTLISQGTNTITVSATDVIGNPSSPVSAVILLDTTTPVTTASPTGGLFNAVQTVTLTANKTSTIYFTIDGTMPTTDSPVYTAPIAVTYNTEIKYFAKDLAGNSEIVKSQTYSIDLTPPTVSIGAPTTSLTESGVINYLVTYTGADAITLTANDVTLNTTGNVAGSVSVTGTGKVTRIVTIASISGNGTLGISIGAGTASDLAGNSAPPTGPSTIFNVDNTPPLLALSTLADGSTTNNATLNIAGTVRDASGVRSLVVSSQTVTLTTNDNINYTFNYLVTLVSGSNVVTTVATDMAGNTTIDTRTIILDLTTPGLTITSPADNSFSKTASLIVTGTVDITAAVLISLNSGPSVTAVGSGNSFTLPVSLAPGQNTITIVATDLAGNTTTIKRTVTYDAANPLLAITSPPQDLSMNQASVSISGTVSDVTNVTILVSCPTASVGIVTTPTATIWQVTITNMTPGVNIITVTATDQAENSSVASRNIIYDIVLPIITVNPVTTPTSANNQLIGGTREQDAEVVVSCPTASVGMVTYPSAITWQAAITLMSQGTNTITVATKDAAGNAANPLVISIVYDPYAAISGDINGDGVVDMNDALEALQIAAGLYTPTAAELTRGDVAPFVSGIPHPDGKLDINDVVVILRKSVGLISW